MTEGIGGRVGGDIGGWVGGDIGERVGGDIELAGPVLASGYRLDPAGTAEAFAGGWFRTRDAGSLADGVLTVHGRLDDVLISGGVNVSPQAVEAVLREHPTVSDAVVAGLADPEWGQRVVAAVVPAPGAVPDLAALRSWVADRLGAAAAPRALTVVGALPTLHTGKPDRRAVARMLNGGDL